jgi:hypothetical protein
LSATLDRCLARHRFTREELMERCARALEQVTGEPRQLSDKTFYNDIRALREGLVLGRAAPIRCVEGRYCYAEPGFTLFGAGHEELARMEALLEAMAVRAQQALRLLHQAGVDASVLAEVRALLALGEPVPPQPGTVAQPTPRTSPAEEVHGLGKDVLTRFWHKVTDDTQAMLDDALTEPAQEDVAPMSVERPEGPQATRSPLYADRPKAGPGWLSRLVAALQEVVP